MERSAKLIRGRAVRETAMNDYVSRRATEMNTAVLKAIGMSMKSARALAAGRRRMNGSWRHQPVDLDVAVSVLVEAFYSVSECTPGRIYRYAIEIIRGRERPCGAIRLDQPANDDDGAASLADAVADEIGEAHEGWVDLLWRPEPVANLAERSGRTVQTSYYRAHAQKRWRDMGQGDLWFGMPPAANDDEY